MTGGFGGTRNSRVGSLEQVWQGLNVLRETRLCLDTRQGPQGEAG